MFCHTMFKRINLVPMALLRESEVLCWFGPYVIGILAPKNSSIGYNIYNSWWIPLNYVCIWLQDDGTYEVVQGSGFVISRVAFRDNSSKYYINDRGSNFTEVTRKLKGKGVDLDNNRFLILQVHSCHAALVLWTRSTSPGVLMIFLLVVIRVKWSKFLWWSQKLKDPMMKAFLNTLRTSLELINMLKKLMSHLRSEYFVCFLIQLHFTYYCSCLVYPLFILIVYYMLLLWVPMASHYCYPIQKQNMVYIGLL